MNNLQSSGFKLSHYNWNRRVFDPRSSIDLKEYQYFLANSRWLNNCPFHLEWPFNNVVDMIKHKIIKQHLDSLIDTTRKGEKA